ncbi:MAG TPA: MFS transporter [Candidatus Binatia bacterium]|nr:MFS transporter [Candidatus Binatia bacterium]
MQASPAPRASMAYAWTVVGILMMAYVFSFIDRQILSLMVAPIRRDLGIDDTQMSLLGGLSFALLYAVMGFPLGRIADRGSRRGLIAAGVVAWSVMTALCGIAHRYWQMFLFRIGVGIGEAALSPAAYSLIADYFPPERRATAISVYSMGIYIGSGLAFLLGGLVVHFISANGAVALPLLGETAPWRVVFFLIGGAGIVFALAFTLVREPPRQGAAGAASFGEVLGYLWQRRRAVLCHNFGFALISMCSYGSAFWVPAFMMRTYGWNIGQVAVSYGPIVMLFGSAGIVFGGRLADHWLAQGHTDAGLRVGRLAAALALSIGGLYLLAPSGQLAVLGMIPGVFCLGMPFGAAPASLQELVPNRMRGQATAVYLFIVNLVGLGIGPTAVALLTDRVFHDDNLVGASLICVGVAANIGAIVVLSSGLRAFREGYAQVHPATVR